MKAAVVVRVEVEVLSDHALTKIADDIREFASAYGKAAIIEEEFARKPSVRRSAQIASNQVT